MIKEDIDFVEETAKKLDDIYTMLYNINEKLDEIESGQDMILKNIDENIEEDNIDKIIEEFEELNYNRYLIDEDCIIFSTGDMNLDFWDNSNGYPQYLEIGSDYCACYVNWDDGDYYCDHLINGGYTEYLSIDREEIKLAQRIWELAGEENFKVWLKNLKEQ